MDTVLGVSITSTSVGWVLADGSADDDATLDHDAFDVDVGDTSQHAVAVRGAQAIAAATGHEIRSIGLTWTHDAETEARQLLHSLRESGYDNVVEVRLSQATKAWAQGIGRELGYQTAAVCVVEPAAVTLLTVDARGAVQIDVTQSRDSANPDGLSRWLSDVLNGDRREPDSLLLLGSRSDRDELTARIDEALPMPVIGTAEAQLVLARGAALALANNAVEPVVEDDEDPGEDEQPPPGPSWISSHTRDALDHRNGWSGGRRVCVTRRASSAPRREASLANGNPHGPCGIRAAGYCARRSTVHCTAAPPVRRR